jgi:flagellar hook-associated protein 3 FlgL
MRISTGMAFDSGVAGILNQQNSVIKTQEQLSSGLRVNSAADDPIAAANIVNIESSKALNQQYLANQTTARNDISTTESNLGQATNILQGIRSLLVQAGDGGYSDQDRADLATQIQAQSQALLSLVNSKDSNGHYVFSGFQENTPAFVQTATGYVFQGDSGNRQVQVSSGTNVTTSLSASNVFDRVPTGNGVFATGAPATNAGSALIDGGQVANAQALDGHSYSLSFHVAAGVTTYDVIDDTASATVSSGNAYVDGAAISVAGMQADVSGAPADGDKFTLTPSTNRNIFDGINDAIKLLRTSAATAAPRAQLGMGMAAAMAHVDRTLDQVSQARTETGVALSNLDQLGSAANAQDTGYQQQLSQIRDVDYTKAVSDLVRNQTSLQASQQAFAKVMGHSLFDYLPTTG